ncbi:hypothetical protein M758_6G152800 [Ceratodon purpureus]|nr:hypothetical protein M758_6G152800 [Ceratodon purpureus]
MGCNLPLHQLKKDRALTSIVEVSCSNFPHKLPCNHPRFSSSQKQVDEWEQPCDRVRSQQATRQRKRRKNKLGRLRQRNRDLRFGVILLRVRNR